MGFTLVELIVGIVALAIVLTLMTTFIFPQARNSVSPIYQVRAAELGNSLLGEVMGRGFDENSDFTGGTQRCGEQNYDLCTDPANFGPDGETRDSFNDVDDYHQLESTFPNLQDALGEDIAVRYPNFGLAVAVCYSDDEGNCGNAITPFKRITVTVTTPDNTSFAFSGIRGNF